MWLLELEYAKFSLHEKWINCLYPYRTVIANGLITIDRRKIQTLNLTLGFDRRDISYKIHSFILPFIHSFSTPLERCKLLYDIDFHRLWSSFWYFNWKLFLVFVLSFSTVVLAKHRFIVWSDLYFQILFYSILAKQSLYGQIEYIAKQQNSEHLTLKWRSSTKLKIWIEFDTVY